MRGSVKNFTGGTIVVKKGGKKTKKRDSHIEGNERKTQHNE